LGGPAALGQPLGGVGAEPALPQRGEPPQGGIGFELHRVGVIGNAFGAGGEMPSKFIFVRGDTVRTPGQPPRQHRTGSPLRNRLGAVTFLVVVIAAVLAVIPATAAFGFLLCLLALVPAIIANRRVRRGRADNRRQALAAVVLAPLFLVVAASVGAATSPAVSAPGVPAVESAPVNASPPVPPLTVPTAPAGSALAAPLPAPTTVPAPGPAAGPAQVLPVPVETGACDEETHYVNSSGACVLRPVAATAPPAGATAKCNDGTYSSSQHRQGTCSRHGGVAEFL